MHRLISRIEVNIYRIFCELDRVWTQKSLTPSPLGKGCETVHIHLRIF
jgi:hypothetical protein